MASCGDFHIRSESTRFPAVVDPLAEVLLLGGDEVVANGGEVGRILGANGVNSRKYLLQRPMSSSQIRGDVRMSHVRSLGNTQARFPWTLIPSSSVQGPGADRLGEVAVRAAVGSPAHVVESAGEWMTAWRAGFARQCIDVLRARASIILRLTTWPSSTPMAIGRRSRQRVPLRCTAGQWVRCNGPRRPPSGASALPLETESPIVSCPPPSSAQLLSEVALASSWKVELDDGSTIGARQVVGGKYSNTTGTRECSSCGPTQWRCRSGHRRRR